MFSMVRDQVYHLINLLRKERSRHFKTEKQTMLLRLPIITARKDEGIYLSEFNLNKD